MNINGELEDSDLVTGELDEEFDASTHNRPIIRKKVATRRLAIMQEEF